MYYKTCPLCKASLDPGEKCVCRMEIITYSKILSQEKDGQMSFNFKKKKEPVA